MKKRFEIEYPLGTSSKVIYKRLSTSAGLSEWFADDVTQDGNIFTFIWSDGKEKAIQVQKEKRQSVTYRWLDDEEDEGSEFKFRLIEDELTNSLSLIVEDFAEESEVEESIELWNKQIAVLKRKLGI